MPDPYSAPSEGRHPGGGGRRLACAALALFLLALFLRAIPAPATLREDGVSFPAKADEMWHMRRIWYIAVNFPDTLPFDYYASFPHGQRLTAPPLFDFLIGGAARVLVGARDQGAVERFAAWVPPVVGAATAALLCAAVWLTLSPAAGVAAGTVLAILPGHFFQSQIGMVDHHVAVVFGMVLMLWLAMRLLSPGRAAPTASAAAGLGLVMGGLLTVWTGALLHILVVQSVATLWTLLAASRESAIARARALALAHAVAVVPVLPAGLGPEWEQFGHWSPLVLSRLQPGWLGAAALLFVALTFAWRTPLGASPFRRFGSALAVGGLGVALFFAFVPDLAAALVRGAGYFGKELDVLHFGAEVQPLLLPLGAFDPSVAATQLSWFFFVFPLVWAWLALRAVGDRWGADRWLVLVWAAVFFVACLSQIRFVAEFVALYAVVAGMGVEAAMRRLQRVASGRQRLAWAAGAALVLGLGFQPVFACYAVQVAEARAGRRSASLMFASQDMAEASARWLRTASPATAGFLDASQRPEYGVLCSWGVAHLVRYRAERPTVHDAEGVYGRQENVRLAWDYYEATDEAEATAILDALQVRYVLADALGAGSNRPYARGTMTHRMTALLGSATRTRERIIGATSWIPALAHHRLIHRVRWDQGTPGLASGTWERVSGARIEGHARPRDRVDARLDVDAGGFRFVYHTFAIADAEGRYGLTLPYPNDAPFSSAVTVGDAYTFSTSSGSAAVVVSEEAVHRGLTIEGPAFPTCTGGECGAPGPP